MHRDDWSIADAEATDAPDDLVRLVIAVMRVRDIRAP